jgi:GSCFA family
MNFTTKIPISKNNNPIDYNSKIMSIGSCFAENMAEKFEYFKFQISANPFGIIFNPVSIEKLIYRVVHQQEFTEKDIFFHNERWHCYEVHSDLSNSDKILFLKNLNEILAMSYIKIIGLSHFIITLGTSWVYRNIETNQIVANCHKMPQNHFKKELLSAETIQKSIGNITALIQLINNEVKFIFTVSPVRHIKDGFVENNVNKSHLISAIFQVLQVPPLGAEGDYFPSYEILLDELRDYRFYDDDMLHPSQAAIDYIWIKFFENYVLETEFETMQQVCDIQKALNHKPFNPTSESHQQFLSKLQDKIKGVQVINSSIKF